MGTNGGCGHEIRLLADRPELERLAGVFGDIWGTSVVSPDVTRALAHSGSYVAGLFDTHGEMVGGSIAFRGLHHGRPSLHSHVTGIVAHHAHTGLGRALKQHQRQWAQGEELAVITWTFDPLVRRNGWFNLHTLGADVESYLVDFYGPLVDDINGEDETDRLLAVWRVDGQRATDAAGDRLPARASGEMHRAVALVDIDDHQRPVVASDRRWVATDGTDDLLIAVPADIVELRRRDRRLGKAWRTTVREQLGDRMANGWSIIDMTVDGYYVLREGLAP